MDKKIILGSIITVAIIIGVSFTSVVGYHSTSKTIAEISPLFNVRAKRAINQENDALTCDYVGKGEKIKIPLPKLDNKTLLIKRINNILNRMDEKQLEQFRDSLKKYTDINKPEQMDENFAEFERLIQNNPEVSKEFVADSPISLIPDSPCTIDNWRDLCYLIGFIMLLALSPIIIPVAIAVVIVIGVFLFSIISLGSLFFIMYIMLEIIVCVLLHTWDWGPLI